MLMNGLHVERAPDQYDLMARARQHATEVASYRPCAYDSDSHTTSIFSSHRPLRGQISPEVPQTAATFTLGPSGADFRISPC
jgi:hypothetical protein